MIPFATNSGASRVSYQYDRHGNVTRKQQQLGTAPALASDHQYDDAGRLEETTMPSGAVISYGYGADGRVVTIRVNGVVIVSEVEYFPFGEVKRWLQGNGNHYIRNFDTDGRLEDFTVAGNTRSLAYDAASRIIGQQDQGAGGQHNWTYTYDDQDRLKSATNASATGALANAQQSWTYDATGNRQSTTLNGISTSYTTDEASNRLAQIGTIARSYDAAGNTTNDGIHNSTTNARNRLSRVALPGNITLASYAYDAFGARVCKASGASSCPSISNRGSGFNQYFYDELGHQQGEYDSQGRLIQETLWIDDTPIAVLKAANGPTAISSALGGQIAGDQVVFWIEPDHLDTPRAIVNANRQPVWRWDSAPFGETPANENPSNVGSFVYNLRFPGQHYDAETRSHYNYFRDYEPSTGRYVQSDPIGLIGGWATYSYVNSQPLSWFDPLGEVKRGPKPKPHGPHNEKIDELTTCIINAGGKILSGGNRKERVIPTPGGKKKRPTSRY